MYAVRLSVFVHYIVRCSTYQYSTDLAKNSKSITPHTFAFSIVASGIRYSSTVLNTLANTCTYVKSKVWLSVDVGGVYT